MKFWKTSKIIPDSIYVLQLVLLANFTALFNVALYRKRLKLSCLSLYLIVFNDRVWIDVAWCVIVENLQK